MNAIFKITLIALMLVVPRPSSAKDFYPRNPAVDVLHYTFHIELNDSTDRIGGKAEVLCFLSQNTRKIMLDLVGLDSEGKGMAVSRVETGGRLLKFNHQAGRLEVEVPDTLGIPGEFTINIEYSGIPADGLIISKSIFGERTFFADNWPDRARNWIPCVDHPSDKATVDFIVTAPDRYKVVGNGFLFGEYPVMNSSGTAQKVTHWKEEVPVPTKVMVFGAADFAWETAGFSKGIPVQSWVYAQNRDNGFIDYRPAADILTFYQDLIGPYSYEKLANVQSKTMFGGMENSGCIFYYEKSVTGKNHLHSLLAHEIAHQWFGDAVTENDWHHIWLSEGFATYLEAVYADSLIDGRQLDASMADMRKSVIRFYEKTGKPVIDTTVTNNMSLLNTNSYQKGAWVLHMLRQELGNEVFWNGIRSFYAQYRDKNAMTSDLQKVMEEASGRPLGYFFHQWLEIGGQPVIQWSWSYNKKKKQVEIDIEQTQEQFEFVFDLPVELLGEPNKKTDLQTVRTDYQHVIMNQRKMHFSLPVDFPVGMVKLDPRTQLLFQEKLPKE